MTTESTNLPVSQYILSLLNKGQKREQIETELLGKGHEEYFVKQVVAETIKMRNAKLRSQGLMFILAGAAVCLISCILTLSGSFTQSSFPLVLYGLTSGGIVLVFAGFVKVF